MAQRKKNAKQSKNKFFKDESGRIQEVSPKKKGEQNRSWKAPRALEHKKKSLVPLGSVEEQKAREKEGEKESQSVAKEVLSTKGKNLSGMARVGRGRKGSKKTGASKTVFEKTVQKRARRTQ